MMNQLNPIWGAAASIVLVHENMNYSVRIPGTQLGAPNQDLTCGTSQGDYPSTSNVGPYIGGSVVLERPGRYKVWIIKKDFPEKIQVLVQANYKFIQTFFAIFDFTAGDDPDRVLPLTATEVKDGDYPEKNLLSVLNGDMLIYWKLEPKNVINFAIVARTRGWVAIGFNPSDDSMKNCDMIVGFINNNGRARVMDTWSRYLKVY